MNKPRKEQPLCRNFPSGNCNFGDRCRYRHDETTLSTNGATGEEKASSDTNTNKRTEKKGMKAQTRQETRKKASTTKRSHWPRLRESLPAHFSHPPTCTPLVTWIKSLHKHPSPSTAHTSAAPTTTTAPSPSTAHTSAAPTTTTAPTTTAPTTTVPTKRQGRLRFLSVNAENMDQLLRKNNLSANDREACQRLANVINDINPDVAVVVEGPGSIDKMQRFNREYLNNVYTVLGGLDGGNQRVYSLVRRSGPLRMTAVVPGAADQFFDQKWKVDVTGDCIMTRYKYLRRPLVTEITIGANHTRLIVIGVHLKSKHIPQSRQLWETDDVDDKMSYIKKAVENRRRIAAEIQRCRQLIDCIMDEHPNANVLVAGDVNDGPGADLFEQRYLLSNASDALLGSPFRPDTLFCHTLLECSGKGVANVRPLELNKKIHFRSGGVVVDDNETKSKTHERIQNRIWTIEFDDYVDGSVRKVLIDHVLASPNLKRSLERSDVAHESYVKHCKYQDGTYENRKNIQRHHRPADHRPIWADFKLESVTDA